MTSRALLLVAVLVLGLAVRAAGASLGPQETVKVTVDAVIAALADESLDDGAKRDRVIALITERFNFRGMSQRVLATNWNDANEAQKDRFVALFTRMLGTTYWSRMRDYRGQHVEYVGEKVKSEKGARVQTLIVTGDQKIPVDYSLHKQGGEWLAYDVAIEGVSLVLNYRSSYQRIAKQEGIDGLLARMEEKIAESGAK